MEASVIPFQPNKATQGRQELADVARALGRLHGRVLLRALRCTQLPCGAVPKEPRTTAADHAQLLAAPGRVGCWTVRER